MGMDEEQLKRVLELINIAERPIIYAGQGVLQSDASDLLREFAKVREIFFFLWILSFCLYCFSVKKYFLSLTNSDKVHADNSF